FLLWVRGLGRGLFAVLRRGTAAAGASTAYGMQAAPRCEIVQGTEALGAGPSRQRPFRVGSDRAADSHGSCGFQKNCARFALVHTCSISDSLSTVLKPCSPTQPGRDRRAGSVEAPA